MTILVKVSHIRAAKLCTRGARAWFQKYGLDWAEFVSNGLPAEDLEATGDHFGIMVATIAREEASA